MKEIYVLRNALRRFLPIRTSKFSAPLMGTRSSAPPYQRSQLTEEQGRTLGPGPDGRTPTLDAGCEEGRHPSAPRVGHQEVVAGPTASSHNWRTSGRVPVRGLGAAESSAPLNAGGKKGHEQRGDVRAPNRRPEQKCAPLADHRGTACMLPVARRPEVAARVNGRRRMPTTGRRAAGCRPRGHRGGGHNERAPFKAPLRSYKE